MLDLLFEHINLLIDVVLAFITMSLGLNLSRKDFSNIISFPKTLFLGLVAQMVFLPIIAFFFMLMTDFSPEVKVGFIIISLCPGGVTSNLVSFLLKGNVALSISLTVVNGILCMFTVPIFVNAALNYFIHQTASIELPVLNTMLHIAMVTIIPASIGVLIRRKSQDFADKLIPYLRYLLPVLLLIIFSIKIFAPAEKGGIQLTGDEIWNQGLILLLFNFTGMFLGFILGALFKTNIRDNITIMVEVGLQNTALALLVAGNILNNNNMQKPAMVYAIFTFFSTLIFAWIIKTISITYFAPKVKT
ncbi:MAG: bile acid:sodium symporter [Bacteroidia bacterium]